MKRGGWGGGVLSADVLSRVFIVVLKVYIIIKFTIS